MFELFWDLSQERRLWDASGDATKAKHDAKNAVRRITELEYAIDKLVMINRALWELMKEQHQFREEELIAKVNEIDLRDGKRDGKLKQMDLLKCKKCGRTLSKRHPNCMFCGSPDLTSDPFDKVS